MELQTKNVSAIITGRDLRMLRIHAQMTTQEMAEQLNIKSKKTVENWENNCCEPNINAFLQYCQITGFTPYNVVTAIEERNQTDATQQSNFDLSKCLQ